jgi:hypothetical protein
MALEILCNVCRKELEEPGALLISPPMGEHPVVGMMVGKMHICVDCLPSILQVITEYKKLLAN